MDLQNFEILKGLNKGRKPTKLISENGIDFKCFGIAYT